LGFKRREGNENIRGDEDVNRMTRATKLEAKERRRSIG